LVLEINYFFLFPLFRQKI